MCSLSNCPERDLYHYDYECYAKSRLKCHVSPDVTTFDSAKNRIYGVAQYILSEHNDTSCRPNFKIMMNTKPFGEISAVDRTFIMFERHDSSKVEIRINETDASYYFNSTVGWKKLYPQDNSDFTFVNTGLTKRVVTWFGLQVSVTSDYISILCPSLFKGSLAGLCQNMNTDWRDDFKLRNGTVLEYPTSNGAKLSIVFKLSQIFIKINRYRRGLETCPQAKTSKSGHAIFFSFFRRVRATSMTQRQVENTRVKFWTFSSVWVKPNS